GNFFISTSEFVQWAGVAALREAGEERRRFRARFDERRRSMLAGVRALGLGVACEPTGAFYVLANARYLGTDSVRLAREILEAAARAPARPASSPRARVRYRQRVGRARRVRHGGRHGDASGSCGGGACRRPRRPAGPAPRGPRRGAGLGRRRAPPRRPRAPR